MPISALASRAAVRPAAPRRVWPTLSSLALVGTLVGAAGCGGATEPRAGERLSTLEVAPARVACVGVAPMQCLRVRALPDGAWQLFYDSIEGFTYEPGYTWVVRVVERDVPNPPADGSSVAYRLVTIVSRTAAP